MTDQPATIVVRKGKKVKHYTSHSYATRALLYVLRKGPKTFRPADHFQHRHTGSSLASIRSCPAQAPFALVDYREKVIAFSDPVVRVDPRLYAQLLRYTWPGWTAVWLPFGPQYAAVRGGKLKWRLRNSGKMLGKKARQIPGPAGGKITLSATCRYDATLPHLGVIPPEVEDPCLVTVRFADNRRISWLSSFSSHMPFDVSAAKGLQALAFAQVFLGNALGSKPHFGSSPQGPRYPKAGVIYDLLEERVYCWTAKPSEEIILFSPKSFKQFKYLGDAWEFHSGLAFPGQKVRLRPTVSQLSEGSYLKMLGTMTRWSGPLAAALGQLFSEFDIAGAKALAKAHPLLKDAIAHAPHREAKFTDLPPVPYSYQPLFYPHPGFDCLLPPSA